MIKIKIFEGYTIGDVEDSVNSFIQDKDIKEITIQSTTNSILKTVMVVYSE